MERWIFVPIAAVAVLSGGFMLFARNAVHAALLLVSNFFALAVLYVLLDAYFLAAVQVIVYAGAIMVLFLFVIMLLGVDRVESFAEPIPLQRPIAIGLGALLAGGLSFVFWTTIRSKGFAGLEQANSSGNVQGLGRIMFTKYMFPFEVASVLLIIAAIGAMVLGRRRDEEEAASEVGHHGVETPPETREPETREPETREPESVA
jgi:NADH-quinone oxidoreductase subunit J